MIRHNLFPITQTKTIFDEMDRLMMSSFKQDTNYPPYNVYVEPEDDGKTFIEIAVSGFEKDELEAFIDDSGNLVVEGRSRKEKPEFKYIHKSLSKKDFVRKFKLERYLEVADIKVKNGLMLIELSTTEPEKKFLTIK